MKIIVFDVPASESGALAVLTDFYSHVVRGGYQGLSWHFVVSTDALFPLADLSKITWVSIEKHEMPKKSWLHRIWFEVFHAPRLVRQARADGILSLQNLAILRTRVPQVVYVHQSLPYMKRRFSYLKAEERFLAVYADIFRGLIGFSVKRARSVVVQTTWFKDALVKRHRIDADKVSVIAPSVRLRRPSIGGTSSRETFFYPTTPFAYKNIGLIVEAVSLLVAEGLKPKVILTITGHENKYAQKLLASVRARGLEEYVIFHGRVPREQLLQFYIQATMLFPSRLESFGLPLLEARLCGGRIIACQTPFATEILEGYPDVRYCGETDAKELARLMSVALRDPPSPRQIPGAPEGWIESPADWGRLIELLRP